MGHGQVRVWTAEGVPAPEASDLVLMVSAQAITLCAWLATLDPRIQAALPSWALSVWIPILLGLALAMSAYPLWRLWRLKLPDRVCLSPEVIELRSCGRSLSWPSRLVTWVELEGDRLRVEAGQGHVTLGGFEESALVQIRESLGIGERPRLVARVELGSGSPSSFLAASLRVAGLPLRKEEEASLPPEEEHPDFGARLRREAPRGWGSREWCLAFALSLACAAIGFGLGLVLDVPPGVEPWLGPACGLGALLLQINDPYPREVALYERALVVLHRGHWFALTEVQSMTRTWRGVRVRTPYRDDCDLPELSESFIEDAERILVSERLGRPA